MVLNRHIFALEVRSVRFRSRFSSKINNEFLNNQRARQFLLIIISLIVVIPNFLKTNISLWTFVQFRVERYFQEIQILVSFRWLSLQQSSSHQTPNFKQKNTTFTSSECSQRKKKLLQKTEIRERSFKVPKVFERLRSIVALERCSAPWTTSVVPFTIPVFPVSLEQPSRRIVRVLYPTQWPPPSFQGVSIHARKHEPRIPAAPKKTGWRRVHGWPGSLQGLLLSSHGRGI